MSSPKNIAALAFVALMAAPALGQTATDAPTNFGEPVAPEALAAYFSIPPSGSGLPQGGGTPAEGREIYANACVACHGEKLEGVKVTGGLPLVGGRGTLASAKPLKTVESYWPYATTVFDYVKRAMPFNAPGSLSDDQVYAVVAYILAQGNVIGPSDRVDATSLPAVRMPNANGFIPDPRPQ